MHEGLVELAYGAQRIGRACLWCTKDLVELAFGAQRIGRACFWCMKDW